MWAIISDIHSNHEALMAVGEDIAKHDVERVVCLGDIVGYGPNPCECIDVVMDHCDIAILGNHDQGALFDPEGFNNSAERAIFWTRAQIENSAAADFHRRWEFLSERPRRVEEGDFLFVHGSARQPLNEYVFPEDVFNERKMEKIFQMVPKYCFQGHTHVPGVFTQDLKFHAPAEIGFKWKFDGAKTLVNVGSVGQPRDGDNRACYVLLDPGTPPGADGAAAVPPSLEFRRVEYDLNTTVRKIHAITELERFLGDRLRDGR